MTIREAFHSGSWLASTAALLLVMQLNPTPVWAQANLLIGDEFSVASEPSEEFPASPGSRFQSANGREFGNDTDLMEVGQLCDLLCREIRGMVEFDMRNVGEAGSVTLEVEVLREGGLSQQMGPGDFVIELYAYEGNSQEDISDYQRAAFAFVTRIRSEELQLGDRLRFNVTTVYNFALNRGTEHIGFRFQAVTDPKGDAVVLGDATLEVISGDGGNPDPLFVDLFIEPATVERGEPATVFWESRGADECRATNGLPGWSGDKELNGSQQFIPEESGSFNFSISCNQFIVSTRRTATLRVLDAGPVPGPDVALSADRTSAGLGEVIELSWSSENAVSCEASSGLLGFNGPVALSGTALVDATVTGLAEFAIACADEEGMQAADAVSVEINGNNPDLFVADFTPGADQLQPGSGLGLSLLAGNTGDAASAGTRVRFFLSENASISPSDLQVANVSLGAVSVGDTRGASSANISVPAVPGRYWLGACIDAVAGETQVSNNCAPAVPIDVQSLNGCAEAVTSCGARIGGGLSAQDCQGGPRGAGFAASKQTINLTQGAEIAFDAEWFDGMDGFLTLQAPNGGPFVVSNDDFGSTNRSRVEYVADQSGEYTLWVTSFDSDAAGAFEVETICGDGAPDLVTRADSVPDEALIGETLDLRFVYENEGESSGSGFLSLVLSPDSEIGPDDAIQSEIGFSGLAPGGSGEHTFSGRFQAPGVYWVGACVRDSGDEELFSGNNCSEGQALTIRNPSACVSNALGLNSSTSGAVLDEDCDDSPRGAGYPSRGYTFSGTAGQSVLAEVDWEGWDGYVYIEGPDGRVLAQGDDVEDDIFGSPQRAKGPGPDGLEALIPPSTLTVNEESSSVSTQLPVSGEYTVWVTGFEPRSKGDYTVSVTEQAVSGPEFELGQPALNKAVANAGEQVAVTVPVADVEGVGGYDVEVFFLLSTNSTLSDEDLRFANRVTPTLAANSNAEVGAFFEAPISPGTYWIGACAQEAGSQGGNVASADCASTQLTVNSDAPRVTFNPGMNDTWFNPQTDGQGFFIEVFQDIGSVFLTWFTYESAGTSVSNNANVGDARHRWFTAQGSYDESGVDLTVILTRGGRLDRGNTVTREEVGTMRLEFLACNSGVLTYDIETDESGRLTGTIPIQRVVTDNQLLCEQFLSNEAAEAGQALLAVSRPEVVTGEPVSVVWRAPRGMQCRPEGTTANWADATLMGTHGSLPVTMEQAGEHVLTMKCKDGQGRSMRKQTVVKAKTSNDRAQSSGPEIIVNEGLNDAWADPETDGQGVLINVLPEVNAVFAAWFTYDNFDASGGNADVGSADHRWMTAFGPIDGDRSEMQMFVNRGGAFDQGQPPSVSEPYGTLDLSFDSCDEITAKYNLPAAGEAGTMNLRRIVQDRVASCLTKGSNGEDEGRLVRPENKERLPNACNGQLDWVFDWEAFPNATSYEIEISHERDEQPRIREQTANNTYRVRKSSDIPQDQLDGWTWRVRWLRVDTFTILEGPWSEYEFSVEPLSACD